MTESKHDPYVLAGWLAIISAILVVPEIVLAALAGWVSPGLNLFVVPVHIANLVIGVYILFMFRKLLNVEFDFHAADLLITLLIVVNVVFFVIGVIDLVVTITGSEPNLERSMTWITMMLFVPFSILTIVFGAVMLKMQGELYGLLKPYAYTTIASGVCGATVILAPLGLVAAIVALVILGMIFLRAKREAEIL